MSPEFPSWLVPGMIVAIGVEVTFALLLIAYRLARFIAFVLCAVVFVQLVGFMFIFTHRPSGFLGSDLGGADLGPVFIAGFAVLATIIGLFFLPLGGGIFVLGQSVEKTKMMPNMEIGCKSSPEKFSR